MLLNPGSVLGDRYEIIEKIGSGGMAVVYRGKDKKLDRYVTIKVLREEFIGDEEFIERFRSEACSAARLSHPTLSVCMMLARMGRSTISLWNTFMGIR